MSNSDIRSNNNFNNIVNLNLKVLQINLERCKAATTSALKFINDKNIDIIMIQELYKIKNKIYLFSNYSIYPSVDVSYEVKTEIVATNKKYRCFIYCTI